MIINTVRMVDYDQSKEYSLGDDSSLKENLAIGLLNPDDYDELKVTPNLNLKLANEHGQVIIKIIKETKPIIPKANRLFLHRWLISHLSGAVF